MKPVSDNRAVSAMFRVFGGWGRPQRGDAVRRLAGSGAHELETIVLGVVVPIVLGVAMVERLSEWCGPWWAAVLAVPALVLAVHVVGILFGMLARLPALVFGGRYEWLWRVWALGLSAWAVWIWNGGGWARWVAAGWLVLMGVNLVAAVLLGWRRLMKVSGRAGVVLRVVHAVVLHLAMVPLAMIAGWWALAWGAVLGLGWARATFSPNSQGFGAVGCRCDGGGAWLTIDDGPDPETTPRLLELLDEHGVKATFFLIGERAERHPDLAREIVARGHQVGNHTASHPRAGFWGAGPGGPRREIEEGARLIEAATGVVPQWFRAPVGHSNYFTHPVADELGQQVIGWTRRGLDGVSVDVPVILRRLTGRMRGGDILVMHDATPVAGEVLRGVLEAIKEKGLKCEMPEGGGLEHSNSSV